MQSFQHTTYTDLSHLIQELDNTNLMKKPNPHPLTAPNWMLWLFFQQPTAYSIQELLQQYSELEKPETLTIASQHFPLSTKEETIKLQRVIELGK